jgi:hypothetical protein
MPFQTAVAVNPAIGVPGDFASTNPRQFVVSGTANQRMVAAADICLAGSFGLIAADGTVDSTPGYAAASAAGAASRIGFIHRYMGAALITSWLAEASMQIQPGMAVELFATGDFFARADAITGTPTRGAAVIWNPATGQINIGATVSGSTIDTGFILLSETAVAGQIVMIGKN